VAGFEQWTGRRR